MTLGLALLLATTAVAAAAPAQPPAAPSTQATPDSKACAPGERTPANRPPGAPATTGENLSDKLARTDGVICPPNVDPDIKAPTPETGKMPVIPPPGSPGGDPKVQPK
jgi:hypothetical protein